MIAVCVLTTEPSLQIYQLQGSNLLSGSNEVRLLTKNRTIPLLIPAIALSFYEKEHLVLVGAPQH